VLDASISQRLGFGAHHHRGEVDSTMGLARELCASRREDVIISADRQTAGYGRAGRVWHSPGGGLHFSLGLWQPPLRPPNLYVIVAGLATLDVLDSLGVKARLRWPNDVLATWWDGERKISGAIAEVQGGAVVLGVGINVKGKSAEWPAEIRKSAVTLEDLVIPAEPREILSKWLDSFRGWEKPSSSLVAAFTRRCGTIGRQVAIRTTGESIMGVATGVDENGFLKLRVGESERTCEDCLHLEER
jgi:BirA family biotin operon repressor/biotin-[acetyl-CoA-carboxylase] ligase